MTGTTNRRRLAGAAQAVVVAGLVASCTSSGSVPPSVPRVTSAHGSAPSPTNRNKPFTPVGWANHCAPAGSRPDDPIRYFGRPGASPVNDFWGAENAGASSTFDTLAGVRSTCATRRDSSVYWAPQMVAQDGHAVPTDGLFAYYEQPRDADPMSIHAFPPGFAMDGTSVRWSCLWGGAPKRPEPFDCTSYGSDHFVDAWVYFPSCWSGAGNDVVYPVDHRCPADHTQRLPYLSVQVSWPGILDGRNIAFSTGQPSTFHVGFINAWEPQAMAKLTQACLNHSQRCGAVVNFFHRLGAGSPIPGPPIPTPAP